MPFTRAANATIQRHILRSFSLVVQHHLLDCLLNMSCVFAVEPFDRFSRFSAEQVECCDLIHAAPPGRRLPSPCTMSSDQPARGSRAINQNEAKSA